jgi:hypothetical protein
MELDRANELLRVKEDEYFTPTRSSSIHYIAVVKKTKNFNITNDYVIEIGLSDYTCDFIEKRGAISRLGLSDSIKSGIDNGEVVLKLGVKEFKHQSCEDFLMKEITGGASISYKDSTNTRGTAGAFFRMQNDDNLYLLSNHHVLFDKDESSKYIVHPSRLDCKSPIEIGELYWECLNQHLDAAIAKITYPVAIGKFVKSEDLIFDGLGKAKIGQKVSKHGLKSKTTQGEIRSINCTILNTDSNYPKYYRNQILTSCMSQDGDSGSVLVNSNNQVVGLIFGGDDETSTYANDINRIFNSKTVKEPTVSFSKFV